MKVEPLPYEDRKVYSVAGFNSGVAQWLGRLPTVWVEGEVTELRRHDRWASVFLTLKDPGDGSTVGVTMARGQFDGLRLELADGERVHVYGRPELFEQRGDFRLRALTIERFGLGAHLAALERLKTALAAEGLFAAERKRQLPLLPRRIGLVTGNDAAAKRDVITTIQGRFPAANVARRRDVRPGSARRARDRRRASRPLRAAGRRRDRPRHAAAAASRICCRSATSGSCARWLRARCRSSPRSATSRTRRSATSPPTFARPRRRWRASSSSRSSLSCRVVSTAHARHSAAASSAPSSAMRSGSAARPSGFAPRRGWRSSGSAGASSARTSVSVARLRLRSSGSGRRSRRRPADSLRCHRRQH